MKCVDPNYKDRVYLPSQNDGVDVQEYLKKYIEREFSEAIDGKNAVYSVPSKYSRCGEKQASFAEEIVFNRLRGLSQSSLAQNLWMIYFYSATYAGHSFRNQRIGKLMIREHDFVIFVKYQGKYFLALAEVKSTYDGTKLIENVKIVSDAKAIKNNKRSAQHQLRDHLEVLQNILKIEPKDELVQSYIMWPFLNELTKDPKQNVIKRWKEDSNLHVFDDNLLDQNNFDAWFMNSVLSTNGISEEHFFALLNRYVILSCGAFVDEIHEGMLAFLTQEQLELITSNLCNKPGRGPMVVHGAAGTGKTLLVLKKMEQLREMGLLNENNRALYICYWPGIRFEMEQKLKYLGLDKYVDTSRFYISQSGFLQRNNKNYKHIFMDEAEAVCLAFDASIISNTISTIFERYHNGNCSSLKCIDNCPGYPLTDCKTILKNSSETWGELWFLVDINQASIFLPKHSPQILKKSTVVLNKVMRTTGYIFNIFKQYYSNPTPKLPESMLANMHLSDICMGHHILGPPILWVNSEDYYPKELGTQNATAKVVIDLCATKGFKPNDLCILPFLTNDNYLPENINKVIDQYFVENGYRPRGVGDVELFLSNREVNDFLIAWALRVKGLEFKVVIMVIEDDDFDARDAEDRKKTYIMASRCTCMLILISRKSVKDDIDLYNVMENYPFNIQL